MTVVDVHHHWLPAEDVENITDYLRAGDVVKRIELTDGQTADRVFREGIPLLTLHTKSRSDVENRLDRMDEAGVDAAVLTAATWQTWLDTLDRCREYNDKLYDRVVSEHPDRFVGAAHVPVGTEYAADELERCVDEYGFQAASIVTHMHKHIPDEESYHPLYERAEELDVPVLVHVAGTPMVDNGMHEYDMARTAGRKFDHHVVVGRLLRSDVFEKYPDVKFVHGHLGGSFMFQVFRYGSRGAEVGGRTVDKHGPALTPEEFRQRMENNYFATTYWDRPAIEYAATQTLGADRMIYGSDYPMRSTIMAAIKSTIEDLDIPDADKHTILHDNGEALFDV